MLLKITQKIIPENASEQQGPESVKSSITTVIIIIIWSHRPFVKAKWCTTCLIGTLKILMKA